MLDGKHVNTLQALGLVALPRLEWEALLTYAWNSMGFVGKPPLSTIKGMEFSAVHGFTIVLDETGTVWIAEKTVEPSALTLLGFVDKTDETMHVQREMTGIGKRPDLN